MSFDMYGKYDMSVVYLHIDGLEHDDQWHVDCTSEPEYHITACRPFPNYYHPGFAYNAERREIMDGIIREVICTADDEIPKCGLCDHFCDDYDCSKYCGAEHGWHGYERVVYLSEEE